MSNSTFVTVRGTAYWAKVFPENKDATGYEDELKDIGGQYTVNVDLDEESVLKLTKLNSQAVDYPKPMAKWDDDSEEVTTYRFKRQHEKYSRAGVLLEWASGPVPVLAADGTTWDVEEDGFLGNGTEVELKVCVYKAGRNYGTRLEQVKVLNYVAPPVREEAA